MKNIYAKTILSTRTKVDSWFGGKYNMNLYRGCEHQCIYCDSRSECYGIDNFADIQVKVNAIDLLKKELASKRIKGTICFGAMNDPYMPVERKLKITRMALETILKYKFPVHLMTKSDLVLRDLDLIKEISKVFAAVTFTITTADDSLARKVEPFASPPSARFSAMKELTENGIYCGITMMPILPFIEDSEENIKEIVEEGHKAGAQYILPYFGMTLRDRQRDYYYKKLDELFPGVKEKYIKRFGSNYECDCPNAASLSKLLKKLCLKYGITLKMKVFEPIPVTGEQLALKT